MLVWLFAFITTAQAHVISSPENCLRTLSFPCVVLTKEKTTFTVGENRFYFSSNSLMSFASLNDIYLVRGHMWSVLSKPNRFKTQFGIFEVPEHGAEMWMTVDKEVSALKVFAGVVQVTPKGGQAVDVPSGREVRVSTVDYSKRACYMSNVSVIDFNEYVRHYGRVFPFGDLSVEEHLQKVAGAVLMASSYDSVVLKKQVARQLASDIARDLRLKVEREKATALEIYLRKLFRIKSNFED